MLGQSKTPFQAEIDATCELADFFRFNARYMAEIYAGQPASEKGVWNHLEYRALEGFVFALTPFNFTAIAGNLCGAPAIMGNTVVWKPASTAVLSGYYIMQILAEAGLPDGVINFVPGKGSVVGASVFHHPDLAGIHFTGSTSVFKTLWKTMGSNIDMYRSYPRMVGETGGKDYIFVHPSARVAPVVAAAVRGAFEYQGQKCSACSRMYIPESLWDEITTGIKAAVEQITVGSVTGFRHFMNALIDEAAFDNAVGYIDRARTSDSADILAGGHADKSTGYFIEPTVIVTTDPSYESMTEEIFGPILTLYEYKDTAIDDAVALVDNTSPYALTGAVFAQDRQAIQDLTKAWFTVPAIFTSMTSPPVRWWDSSLSAVPGPAEPMTSRQHAQPAALDSVRTIKENLYRQKRLPIHSWKMIPWTNPHRGRQRSGAARRGVPHPVPVENPFIMDKPQGVLCIIVQVFAAIPDNVPF